VHERDVPAGNRDTALADGVPAQLDDAWVTRLRVDVARAVRRVCPHWLANHVDDLTQIATARVMSGLGAKDPTSLKPGYLYRAAYSALVDEIRRRRRLSEVPIEPDAAMAAAGDGPERAVRAREIRDALTACLKKLAIDRRRAVMLRLQGHSVAEAGALMACGHKRAENLVYRGLADLRSCLRLQGITP
jgi:RNA polymerase sigma-70 factor (ECF subfamily)